MKKRKGNIMGEMLMGADDEVSNTTQIDPGVLLAAAVIGGQERLVENMEARGQEQLVQSDLLPKQGPGYPGDLDRAAFEKLGFVFGEDVEGDPLFVHATLPAGWSRRATDHVMHSKILDQYGRVRVGIFYKAASYDRRAHMSLTTAFSLNCVDKDDWDGPYVVVVVDCRTGEELHHVMPKDVTASDSKYANNYSLASDWLKENREDPDDLKWWDEPHVPLGSK